MFEAKQVILPELALMHFNIYDQSDNKRDLAYVALPLNCIRPGFRFINLLARRPVLLALRLTCGQGAGPLATLFVRIDIAVYVPDEHADFMLRLQNPTV